MKNKFYIYIMVAFCLVSLFLIVIQYFSLYSEEAKHLPISESFSFKYSVQTNIKA